MHHHIHSSTPGPIHYWVGRNKAAPAIVFLHGATMDSETFDAQIAHFARDYRILVWDAPGHGRSQPLHGRFTIGAATSELIAILDKEDITRAVFVGQSMGGLIAQFVLRLRPDLVAGIVAIGSPFGARSRSIIDKVGMLASRIILRLIPARMLYRLIGRGISADPAVQAYGEQAAAKIPKEQAVRIWEAVLEGLVPDARERFDVPILVTHGENDNIGTVKADAAAWAARDAKASLSKIERAGHVANQDQPDAFNALLGKFLRETF
ncbi:alpha/beta hydrolase [Mesorhizobium sp. SB112]|uniref:alpha/beta fold hydrolase n=1 Tax=Mesorhizobium sp. SB112 TaxID=3151853 RepID=UPI003263AC84